MSTPAPAATGFRAPPAWVVVLFIVLGLAALGAAFFIPLKQPVPKGPDPVVIPAGYGDAPPFVLTERLGGTVDNSALDGKVWVAEFAFTRCKYCPQVAATMGKLRSEMKLEKRDDFRMVTFTIDPDHDTPGELRKYADKFSGTPDDPNWLFLHGSERYMKVLATRGFKVGVEKKEGVEPALMYDHFLGLLVVDKSGRVRGKYFGKPSERVGTDEEMAAGQKEFEDSYAELKKKITELLAEPVMTDALPAQKK